MLVDVHCHIHEKDYPLEPREVLARAHKNGVDKILCVGTSEESSKLAVEFASCHEEAFAAIGVHPHESKDGWKAIINLLITGPTTRSAPDFRSITNDKSGATPLRVTRNPKIVAVGEIGLDYYYDHSPRDVQRKVLKEQIAFALEHDLPIIFHVRDAFDDFWPIFDSFKGIRGEMHSFTDNKKNLEESLKRGLYIGINGISTFTKDESQIELYKSIPLDKLLVETDSPFLTPVPFRGTINQPAFVMQVAQHQAKVRGISLEEIANATTDNAHALFAI